ncbi:MAG: type I restriction-modification system subunit M [Thermoleophilia bacterium]
MTTDSTAAGEARPNGGDLPFARTLFDACDGLRGHVESAEYKHLVLGLIFLKYISDAFERRRATLEAETRKRDGALFTDDETERQEILEDRDEYVAENVFWVPPAARWDELLAAATQADIGARIDAALEAIEKANDELRGVLPRIYARAPIAPTALGELLSTIARVGFGDDPDQARDLLGRVYEYFIKTFARSEGHRGGEFYTPASVTRLLVEMLEPYEGRVLDPACGSGGLFIQSGRFVAAHGGRARALSIYGQENNQATWRICRMNLAIHGLAGNITLANTLLDDRHKDLRADFVLANPPFNMKKWGSDRVAGDVRWAYGAPPEGNANYAWIQHFIHHLAPDGRAGFVLANGSLTGAGAESEIRKAIILDDLVDCIVALPAQLFFTTGIPVCLWFLDRNKASSGEHDRRGKVLFIDARQMGSKISRTQIELADEEIARVVGAYHAWRGTTGESLEAVLGFSASASLEQIEAAGWTLSPGRYVGAPEAEEDEIAFEERMAELVDLLASEMSENERLAHSVREAMARIGYDA